MNESLKEASKQIPVLKGEAELFTHVAKKFREMLDVPEKGEIALNIDEIEALAKQMEGKAEDIVGKIVDLELEGRAAGK